jgi:D-alanyl-D-alanine dipeptidase
MKELIKINNELKQKGFCIKIYDAYRPIEIQKLFWEFFYQEHGYYDENLVANPNKYGTHNITINAIDMFKENLDSKELISYNLTYKQQIRYIN